MTESDRPMSTTVQPPSPEPLRARLSDADDRIRLNHWMPPQQGIFPRIRVGSRWINTLWALPIGAAALLCLVALAQSLRELPSVTAFIQNHPGIAQSAPSVDSGFPRWLQLQHFLNMFFMLFIMRAGLQILADHPQTLLGPRLHAGERLVPVSGAGAEGPHLDCQGRFRHAVDMARHSGPAPHARAVALVAFLDQPLVADQRHRVLCAAVFNRPVAKACAADLGGFSGGAFDCNPICLAELSGR